MNSRNVPLRGGNRQVTVGVRCPVSYGSAALGDTTGTLRKRHDVSYMGWWGTRHALMPDRCRAFGHGQRSSSRGAIHAGYGAGRGPATSHRRNGCRSGPGHNPAAAPSPRGAPETAAEPREPRDVAGFHSVRTYDQPAPPVRCRYPRSPCPAFGCAAADFPTEACKSRWIGTRPAGTTRGLGPGSPVPRSSSDTWTPLQLCGPARVAERLQVRSEPPAKQG